VSLKKWYRVRPFALVRIFPSVALLASFTHTAAVELLTAAAGAAVGWGLYP
jgi:hypothetical protein